MFTCQENVGIAHMVKDMTLELHCILVPIPFSTHFTCELPDCIVEPQTESLRCWARVARDRASSKSSDLPALAPQHQVPASTHWSPGERRVKRNEEQKGKESPEVG